MHHTTDHHVKQDLQVQIQSPAQRQAQRRLVQIQSPSKMHHTTDRRQARRTGPNPKPTQRQARRRLVKDPAGQNWERKTSAIEKR